VLGGSGALQVAVPAVLFLVGAAIGSFLNVVIFRLPRSESLVHPRSRCLSCGETLGIADLVPVFSYIALRGRCRHCGRGYSPRYMMVELATGLAAVGAWHLLGPTPQALLSFVIVCCLVVVFFVDLDHYIIPDEAVALIAASGVALDVLALMQRGRSVAVVYHEQLSSGPGYQVVLPASVVGMAMGAGVFVVIAFVAERVFRRPGMGWGDVKLAAGMGAVLGPGYEFFTFFLLAVLIGAVVGLVTMALGKRSRRDYLPFGPMLAVAGVVTLYLGDVVTPLVMSRFMLG